MSKVGSAPGGGGASLGSDNVFSDRHSLQMAKVTGSNDEGHVATLNVPV